MTAGYPEEGHRHSSWRQWRHPPAPSHPVEVRPRHRLRPLADSLRRLSSTSSATRGIISCLDAKTGEVKYEGGRVPGAGEFMASPVAYDGKLPLTSDRRGHLRHQGRARRTRSPRPTRRGTGRCLARDREGSNLHPRESTSVCDREVGQLPASSSSLQLPANHAGNGYNRRFARHRSVRLQADRRERSVRLQADRSLAKAGRYTRGRFLVEIRPVRPAPGIARVAACCRPGWCFPRPRPAHAGQAGGCRAVVGAAAANQPDDPAPHRRRRHRGRRRRDRAQGQGGAPRPRRA